MFYSNLGILLRDSNPHSAGEYAYFFIDCHVYD